MEVRAGIEPTFADLQSAASPLCHRTVGQAARYIVRPDRAGQATPALSCEIAGAVSRAVASSPGARYDRYNRSNHAHQRHQSVMMDLATRDPATSDFAT